MPASAFRFLLLSFAALLTGCDGAFDLHAPLSPAHELAPTQHRVEIQLLDPSGLDTARVRATVVYRPVEPGAPGTTYTTSDRDNCPRGRYDLLPPLFECESTHTRALERDIPAKDLQRDGDRLLFDFDPMVLDDGNAYLVHNVYLSLDRCAGREDCVSESLDLSLTCYAPDRGGSQLGNAFIADYRRGASAPTSASGCGLKDGTWEGWASREFVLQRVVGQRTSEDHVSLGALLPAYAALPTRDGGWRPNPSHGMGNMHDLCPAPQGFDRLDTTWTLEGLEGWPHPGPLDVIVFWETGGGLCSVWVDAPEAGTPGARYWFDFRDGEFAQLRVDAADDRQIAYRFDSDGRPMEWLEQDGGTLGHHAGGEGFRYWNAAAAEEWPERFESVTPDAARFAQVGQWAATLAERAAPLRPPTAP